MIALRLGKLGEDLERRKTGCVHGDILAFLRVEILGLHLIVTR